MPGTDENCLMQALAHHLGLPPGAQAQPNDRGFYGVRGDYPGAFGRCAAVTAEVGSNLVIFVTT